METNNIPTGVTREKLIEDVKVLGKDVQELLKATASVVGERAADARTKVQESLKVAQEKLAVVQDSVRARGQVAVSATDEYVRDNPWNAVGIAVGVGFLIGVALGVGAGRGSRD